jgi:hypothetical protein
MRVDGFASVNRVCAHLNGQRNFTNHVTGMGADHAAAQNLAVAVGLRGIVKQQFSDGIKAAVGSKRPLAMARPHADQGSRPFLTLMPCALRFGLIFGKAHPGHFSGHMGFMHRFVRQHGLANDVTNSKDVRYVGAHLAIDVDERWWASAW